MVAPFVAGPSLENLEALNRIREMRHRLFQELHVPFPNPLAAEPVASVYTQELNTAVFRRAITAMLALAGFEVRRCLPSTFIFIGLLLISWHG
jgi:hypothetical protein